MNFTKKTILLSTLTLALAACGGGGGGGGGSTGGSSTPTSGSASGVFSDAPVAGVAFRTSSGVTGTTSSTGGFTYNPGDTVTFTLGTLTLGSSTAQSLITPINLAGGDENKLSNLLVLLQSLDSDNTPSNGIVINSATANAVTESINLTQDKNLFASSANAALKTAMTSGGISGSIVTPSAAQTHFASQSANQLSANTYVYAKDSDVVLLRFDSAGKFILGEVGTADSSGQSGVELGTVTLGSANSNGFSYTVATLLDTNGQWGMSHPCGDERVSTDGSSLIAKSTCDGTVTLNKASNTAGGIVGVWALGSASSMNTQHVIFLPDGHFFFVDPVGDANCGSPGVEYGSYTFTGGVLSVSNVTKDTNGCAGMYDSSMSVQLSPKVTFSSDGNTASVTDSEGTFIFYRVSK